MNEQVNGQGENNMNGYKPLKEIEAAERLGCKVSTLRKWKRSIWPDMAKQGGIQ